MDDGMVDVLVGRKGQTLQDGTSVGDLVDLERREVAMRVLSDPEVFRIEMKQIFGRAWIGVAHVSEIPNTGDFVLRTMGMDKVIVTRTPKGGVSVLLNVCAHRGFEVCWADHGNAHSFKCPYHGWAFDTSGNLLGAPLEKEMYGDWDKSKYGLRKARVEVRGGIVYATFDQSNGTLEEWLGTAAWYIDQNGNEDRIPVGPPMRFHTNGNWKTFMDQASGDNYHPVTLHRGAGEIGMADIPGVPGHKNTLTSQNHVIISNPEGNTTFAFPPGFPARAFDVNEPDYMKFEERLFAVQVFPQTIMWGPYVYAAPDGSKFTGGALWQVEPTGPESFVMHLQNFIDRDAPEAVVEQVRQRLAIAMPFVQADDHESNASLQRSARGAIGQEQPLRYFAQGERGVKDWPGPGTVFAAPQKDDSQWNFWRRWLTLMTDEVR